MSDNELAIVGRDLLEGDAVPEALRQAGFTRAIKATVSDGFEVLAPLAHDKDPASVTDVALLDQRLSAGAFFAADATLDPGADDQV